MSVTVATSISFDKYYQKCIATNEEFLLDMNQIQNKLDYISFGEGPIKEYKKTKHKYTYKKKKNIHKTNDIIRGSFWADNLLSHYNIINFINSKEQSKWIIHEIRDSHFPIFTNGFEVNFEYREVFFPRLHRDLRVILKKNEKSKIPVYSELQMHLYGFEEINKKTHNLYNAERDLTRKLYLENEFFSEDDLYSFLDIKFQNISLNEQATLQYNLQAKQKKEKMFLLSGKNVVKKIATKNKISIKEQMLNMATKGLLGTNHRFSVKIVETKYEKYILEQMGRALSH